MIEYDERFKFENDMASFEVYAHTFEHGSGYGNDTLLVFDVKSEPKGYGGRRLLDVRYEGVCDAVEMRELVLNQLECDYGWREA